MPKQWKKFLACSYNKQQLAKFLLHEWGYCQVNELKGVTLVVATNEQCHSIQVINGQVEVQPVQELFCNHKEADTRMFLNAQCIAKSSNNAPVIIRSPDTDVFIIAVASTKDIGSPLYFHTGREDKSGPLTYKLCNGNLGILQQMP